MTLFLEIMKIVGAPILAVLLAGLIGNRLSAKWAWRQKRREQAQAAADQLFRLYGEFFAVWKLSNYELRQPVADAGKRFSLLERAAAAEGSMESLLVKIACERRLTSDEIRTLGCFRQGYQRLRQMIRDGKPLKWNYSEHPEYLAFKRLSASVTRICTTIDEGDPPSTAAAREQLEAITSNEWENKWSEKP
jgi:hypothetical protein